MASKHKETRVRQVEAGQFESINEDSLEVGEEFQLDETQLAGALAGIVPEGYVEDQSGAFPPYWTAGVGKGFRGIPLDMDDKDPDFIRYVFQLTSDAPLECKQGPSDDAEIVPVRTNEQFTCSSYATLPVKKYFGYEIALLCVSLRKMPGNAASKNKPRTMYTFKIFVPPETKKQLDAARQDDAILLRDLARSKALKATQERREKIAEATRGNTKQMKSGSSADAIT